MPKSNDENKTEEFDLQPAIEYFNICLKLSDSERICEAITKVELVVSQTKTDPKHNMRYLAFQVSKAAFET